MNNAAASNLLKDKLALDIEPIAKACQDWPPENVLVYNVQKPAVSTLDLGPIGRPGFSRSSSDKLGSTSRTMKLSSNT